MREERDREEDRKEREEGGVEERWKRVVEETRQGNGRRES